MVRYVCGSSKEEINISEGNIRSRIRKAGFYDSDWEPDETKMIIGSAVKKFGKKAVTYNLTVDFLGNKDIRAENANRFFEMTETDVLNETPGRLYKDDWYIECYVIGRESGGRDDRKRAIQVEEKIYAPYPFWIKETPYYFRKFENISTNNKRYPGRYSYRYANGMNSGYIINEHFVNTNFKMIIYGPAVNPMVAIGGVQHLVNIVLETGEYLIIDSKTKTVIKVMQSEEQVNAYHNRQKQRAFFQKIAPGRQTIMWTGKFDFDIILYTERSEPTWKGR